MILYMYIAPGQEQTAPKEQSFDVNRMSCHLFHLLQVSKHVFEVWFYTFCLDLIHVYSPGAGADSPQGT